MTNTKTPIEQMQDVIRSAVFLLNEAFFEIEEESPRRAVNFVVTRLEPLIGLVCKWCGADRSRLVVRGEMSTFTRYRCANCAAEFDIPKAVQK